MTKLMQATFVPDAIRLFVRIVLREVREARIQEL